MRFIVILLPLLCLLTATSTGIYFEKTKTERLLLQDRESNSLEQQQQIFKNIFKSITTDLMVLSAHHDLEQMLDGIAGDHQQELSNEFLAFSHYKGIYDQVRLLDHTGMELVRVNFNSGKPAIVPETRLQSKGKRYYFIDTFALEQGKVFVSPFDLNIEQGIIEEPLKPMIRVGMPVFDSHGRKWGILLLNFLGEKLLHDLEQSAIDHIGQIMLLNSDGYWLKAVSSEDEWGFMYADKKERTIRNRFPSAWQKILSSETGQFMNADGMFTFATIRPLQEGLKSSVGSSEAFTRSAKTLHAKDYFWKVVSHVSTAQLNVSSREFLKGLVGIDAILAILFTVGAWLLARAQISRQQTEHKLEEMAITDGLTNLYNRVYFNDTLENELQRSMRYKTPLCLLMLDIDYFKSINDTYGHQAGDACLVALATLLKRFSRKVDTCARYGGEEFIIILPQTPFENAIELAERMRQEVERLKVQYENQSIQYTVSIGVSSLSLTGEMLEEELLKAADSALYVAKENGRNRVESSLATDLSA
jgi:diguanylate cyclase (GGDEF)-like protein